MISTTNRGRCQLSIECPLCFSKKTNFLFQAKASRRIREFFRCSNCDLVFVPQRFHLSQTEESQQYTSHNNEKNNDGYIKLLMPVLDAVTKEEKARVLEYGCGPGPVLAGLLEDKGFSVDLYDPYFFPEKKSGKDKYDLLTCTEVVEHFCEPASSWRNLFDRLSSKGKAFILTQWTDLVPSRTGLENWHYIREVTHVAFYSQNTLTWIANHFGCTVNFVAEGLAVFQRK